MNFTELKTNMYAAMKAKDKVRKDVLATIIDNSKKIAIERGVDRENVSEDIIIAVILKEKKTLEEMVAGCPDSRAELKAEYNAKLTIINEYAPKLVTDENEIRTLVENSGVELIKANRGKIMGVLKGKCDMKVANQVVGSLLQ